jgi:hypothetical protein
MTIIINYGKSTFIESDAYEDENQNHDTIRIVSGMEE